MTDQTGTGHAGSESPMPDAVEHPDYFVFGKRSGPSSDRCECGGIRYWHGKPPYGCDDCACAEFRLAESDASS